MNLYNIFEEIVHDNITQMRMKRMREEFKLRDDVNWLMVYHGTSEKNAKSITRSKLRSGSWVTTDRSVAELYSQRQAHGGKPYVMVLNVFIGGCLPTGDHIVTQEDLFSTSKGFVPKNLLKKYNEL